MFRVLLKGMRPRWVTAVAVPALLYPLAGCSSAATAVEACMGKQATSVSSVDLTGTYAGEGRARGATITLTSTDGKPGGRVTVHHWPTGSYYRGELGGTFDGSGTWELQHGASAGGHPQVGLSLTEPRFFLPGDTLDTLSIAGDGKRTYLYQEDDPDTCPAFRVRLRH
ncbi:hypothetical protein [Streptomyces sp. NK08204]|uniref:hypothetical protein n=1 Tax=Streptomyces sp. NK08204 TaxID=2873260 RepID=UPI001CEE062C|nr:hypothetical protein [Streptomyces sp. NK08204]